MSNSRKPKQAGPDTRERCSACGRRAGRLADVLRLRTGQVICPRCQQHGGPGRCPSCGRVTLPGSLVIRNEGGNNDIRCPACAPDAAARAGNLRLGMAPRKAGTA
ncbi:MAG TPA: hypothetical protein VNH17_12535 [Streptosporangiaceae bacterium]|nr:hypothetical protein [Streptosporangiaceae bacterium]